MSQDGAVPPGLLLPDSGTPEPDSPAMLTPEQAWAVVAVIWTLYLVVLVLDLGDPLHLALKSLLMPSLLLWVVVALGSQAPALLTGGLALATIGDVGMNFEPPAMFAGITAFLGMQAAYSTGFLRLGAWPVLRERWPIPAGLAAFWVMANLVLGPMLGELRVPLLVYSAALVTTAALAAGVSRRVATGGFIFLVSDLLIGARIAGIGPGGKRASALVVMPTYLAAQYLITTGWARRVRPEVSLPV